ncbi:MAG: tRNA (N(6)-L-threonylcarbamoyladenosine(37)-C(2))-methylthiotransferase MtaB [Bacteroidota bacterium]
MATPKTVAFYTLGCKLNYSETSAIGRTFEARGYGEVKFEEGADIYVINTCSVTDFADRKCRKVVRQALRYSTNAFIVVVGCYAQLKPQEIAEIPGVDLVLGAAEKFRILDYVDDLSKAPGKGMVIAGEVREVKSFVEAFSFGDRTRSFLKVQDGCDYKCSFCTIPLARGKSRSNDIDKVVQQAQEIAARGVKEIVLTGVNIGDFGKGPNTDNRQKGTQFIDLIRQLDRVEGIERFRISSIEPNLCNDKIIEFVCHSERFVPHFHMPLQSGSDAILKLMRRRYKRALYADRVNTIKKVMPHCCIGVDVIVGFPGETEEHFMETYHFLNELDISYLHVFTYSERSNTIAAEMPGKVPIAERRRRNEMLRILSEKKRQYFYRQFLGQFREVLFEAHKNGQLMSGFTDNYIKVEAPLEAEKLNQIHAVQLMNIMENGHVEVNLQETPQLSWIY